MKNIRLIRNFDWLTFSLVIALSVIGIFTIYSATRSPVGGVHANYYIKQIYWLLTGLAALVIFVSFDYAKLRQMSYVFYIGGILLLVAVLVIGKTTMGAERWLRIGPVSLQPSEFFRLFFIMIMSQHLSKFYGNISTTSLVKSFFMFVFVPLVLLIKQPDLGTALVLLALFLSLSLARGLQKKVFVLILVIGLISLPFLGNIFWDRLKDYQKNRLVAFMQPEVDQAGIGYHINQSKIAIGSGEFSGKGYLKGTQGPFRFLPEKHTDFIFAVFAEEWGFLGSLVLMLIYLALLLRGINTAQKAKDSFGRLLASGITFMFAIYLFVNIGMTLGMMPVVGIPLPFMGYGGTALVSNFMATGILINVRMRRFELFY